LLTFAWSGIMSQSTVPRHALLLVLAWLFLNMAINIDYPLSSSSLLDVLRPSLEVWALLLALSLWAAFKGGPTIWVHVTLMLLFVFIRLFRIGDVLTPLYFSRPFNLYIDSGYVPDLIHLLGHSFARQALVLYGTAAAVLVAVLLWAIHKAFRIALEALSIRRLRQVFWGLTALLAVWVCLYPQSMDPFAWGFHPTTCTPRLIEEAAFISKIGDLQHQWASEVQIAARRIPPFQIPLAGLEKSDVYLFIIESYGEALFDHTRHAKEFLPLIQTVEAALDRAGFAMCSRFMESPTTGGESWLAFGTLESGVWTPDQIRYGFLLKSGVQPLAAYFNRAGYRTLSVMPGTILPWPEGQYFQYAETYYAKDLNYRGPPFSWSPMPDQFVINTVHTREIAQRRQPLFIRFMLTSTHAPFNLQPSYLQNWSDIGTGEIYHRLQPITFSVNWPEMKEAGKAYLASMRYDFTVLQDYLCRFVEGGALIIILGDHQPIPQVTGPGASTLVPVHVISRNHAFLEPFVRMGYTPGMVPGRAPGNERGMQEFLADFLATFSTHEPGGASGPLKPVEGRHDSPLEKP
jgi:hypothetical protein